MSNSKTRYTEATHSDSVGQCVQGDFAVVVLKVAVLFLDTLATQTDCNGFVTGNLPNLRDYELRSVKE